MTGLGPNGFEGRTQAEIQGLVETAIDAVEPGVDLRAGPVQALVETSASLLAEAWGGARGRGRSATADAPSALPSSSIDTCVR